jgi:transcriptional regulator with XRE-family HTH domain
VGIDRNFLADVERGERNVSILNVELMAKGLKVSLSQLFRGCKTALKGDSVHFSRMSAQSSCQWLILLSGSPSKFSTVHCNFTTIFGHVPGQAV